MHQCSFVSEEVKSIKFDHFDNSQNSFWPEYFIDFFKWKMDPMSGCNIRLVFTLPPRDSTLQYKRCVHLWNNFPIKVNTASVYNRNVVARSCAQLFWYRAELCGIARKLQGPLKILGRRKSLAESINIQMRPNNC